MVIWRRGRIDPIEYKKQKKAEDAAEDVVVTLTNPRLDGHTLRYDVTLIEGEDNVEGGSCSLFIDVIGMPLTPVFVAGARSREVRNK